MRALPIRKPEAIASLSLSTWGLMRTIRNQESNNMTWIEQMLGMSPVKLLSFLTVISQHRVTLTLLAETGDLLAILVLSATMLSILLPAHNFREPSVIGARGYRSGGKKPRDLVSTEPKHPLTSCDCCDAKGKKHCASALVHSTDMVLLDCP